MLFNSLHFLFFFPVVLVINHLLKGKIQRIFLLGASFYFYMSWRKEFIILLLYSIVIDYFVSLKIQTAASGSKKEKFGFCCPSLQIWDYSLTLSIRTFF
ncbi:hypothetical protein LEP1GSC188_3233 [Leptospira weilii serovar Topaz str. LT2116]|uniref:Membrane-bound O-acyltransferase family MBOAT domain protein n=2 Tax=Leptospira weilii TaxID=28184 RepID=M3FVV9_9LEPT|nr:hypothetical protein LEP1GSC188_3233 [Leptospira weilii serovar Topaz str. LT2116]EMY13653.1 hypothetical protein LEP1GSC043_4611 [Leptospira weilii str. Ecochallenge]